MSTQYTKLVCTWLIPESQGDAPIAEATHFAEAFANVYGGHLLECHLEEPLPEDLETISPDEDV